MEKILATITILLLATCLQAAPATIVKNGRARCQIVTPDAKIPAVEHAAIELQKFIFEITGARLPVVPENKARRGPSFLLGPCRKTVKAGLTERASKLREDGVLIKTVGKDIALLGRNERGHLYSVYVLLEKYWGVRFLAWDCTLVPKRSELSLPELDYSYAPPFMSRETLYFNSLPKDIASRQRLNGANTECDASTGGKISIFPYVHSFDDLFPETEYFKEHPEYYGLQGGKRVAGSVHAQLCLSNPDVLRLSKEKVLKWAVEHPEAILDVSQNDGNGACECEKCAETARLEGSQQGPILRFVNEIAGEVAKKYPDKWVETLAYAYSTAPPAITKPSTNVIIRLCHAGCFFHGFEQCGLGSQHATWLDQWQKLTQRIFIWHYATAFNHYLAPNPNLNGLAKDIKFYASHGVNGVMIQCNYQGAGGEMAELRQYLCAQLLWDPAQDPMRIRQEFCDGYYGPAAGDVIKFLALMDAQSEKPVHAFATWDPKDITPPELVASALKTLDLALSAARTLEFKNRIEKLMLPFWYVKLIHPEKFGLSKDQAPALVARVKRLFETNKIDFVCEGGKNAAPWIISMEAKYPTAPPKGVVFDLLRNAPAKTDNCADWRINSVERGGRIAATIFQHPDPEHNADGTFEIPLPKDEKMGFKFATVLSGPSENGVRFSVLINGEEVWNETKTVFLGPVAQKEKSAHDSILPSANPFSDHTIDLSSHAGKTIRLTLRVNAMSNTSYDWANWIEPKIVIR